MLVGSWSDGADRRKEAMMNQLATASWIIAALLNAAVSCLAEEPPKPL